MLGVEIIFKRYFGEVGIIFHTYSVKEGAAKSWGGCIKKGGGVVANNEGKYLVLGGGG